MKDVAMQSLICRELVYQTTISQLFSVWPAPSRHIYAKSLHFLINFHSRVSLLSELEAEKQHQITLQMVTVELVKIKKQAI